MAGRYFRETKTDNSVARVVRRPGIPNPYITLAHRAVKVKWKSRSSGDFFTKPIRAKPLAAASYRSRACLYLYADSTLGGDDR